MKNKKRTIKALSFLMFTLFFVAVCSGAYAQQKTVSGKIVDEDNQPMPGVTVVVKGTSQGTVSDMDGIFTISGVSSESVLTISFVGMLTQEIAVGDQTTINVALKTDAVGLEEVVVVGYGTQAKATLTGSVAQVKGEDMIKGKGTSSAALALQGEVPGLIVTRNSSRPGNEGIDIKIRGDISVNGTGPLILLDGLEIPEWQLSTINSNDIETYSVLKDGAAAIYGTKAAGGVILITTKKGQAGDIKVSYNGEYQMSFASDFPVANLNEWAQLWLVAGDNDGIDFMDSDGNMNTAASNYRFFTRDELVSIIDGTMPMAPESYYWLGKDRYLADINQYDEVYGTTGSQRHNLSISGGNKRATYRTSLGYSDERSPIDFVYDGAKKYNFRTNVTYKINDIISTDFNVSYDNRLVNEPTQGVGEGVQDMYIFPMYNPQGQYYDTFGANNMLAKLDEGGRTKNKEEIFRLGGRINLDLDKYVKGLSFNYQGNVSSRRGRKTARKTSVTMYDWEGNVSYTPTTLLTSYVKINETEVFFQNHVMQGLWKRSFGDHNVGVMLGVTAEEQQVNKYYMYRSNMASDELDDLNTGDVSTQENAGGSYAESLLSYIGRLNYDYKGIYLAELLGRRDGSSRLHPDYRWKNFYGASVGVRLSEMGFLKDGIFQNLKVYGSYGETGSVTGIGTYDYISNISTGDTQFGSTPALENTAWIGSMTSTDRTWERVAKTNFGIDYALLDSRLSGSLQYFINKNNDMLVAVTYPQVLGATAPKTNSGDFTTKGWEVSANWRDEVGDFTYNVGLSVWDSRSEVTRMEGKTAIKKGVNSIVEGDPLNAIYVYETDGILQTEEEVLNYYNEIAFVDPSDQNTYKDGANALLPTYRSANRLVPGTVKKIDTNGDGIISTDDLTYYGDANPNYSSGLNLGLEYKNFDFSAFFQGVGQQYIVRSGALAWPFAKWWMNQNDAFLGTTWTADNTNAAYPASFYNGWRKNWNFAHTNDINVVNAKYVRAKVITLGYTIPQTILSRTGIDNVRVSVTGNDLFVISNVKDGMDPEMGTSANQGNTVPYYSTLMFGLDITF